VAANATASLTIKLRDLVSGPAATIQKAFSSVARASDGLRKSSRGFNIGGQIVAAGQIAGVPAPLAAIGRGGRTGRGGLLGGFDFAGNLALAGQGITQLGSQARNALTAVLAPAMDFDVAMARVKGITQGLTDNQFKELEAGAKRIGAATGYSAVQAAQGLEQLAQEGFSAAEQLSTLPTVLKLAKFSGLDFGMATDAVTDLLNTFNMKTGDASRVAGMLGATSIASGTSVGQLYDALRTGAPAALAAGVSLEQVTTLIGLLGDAGIKGGTAAMAMNSMLMALGKPSKQAALMLGKIGISGKQMARSLNEPATLLKMINEAMNKKGLDPAMRFKVLSTVFGPRLMKSLPTLLNSLTRVGDDGVSAFDKIAGAAVNGEGVLDRVTKSMGTTQTAGVKKLHNSLQTLYIDLAEKFAPALQPLTKDMQSLIGKIADFAKANPEAVQNTGKMLIYVAGFAAVMGPLTLALSGLASAMTLLKAGIGLARGAWALASTVGAGLMNLGPAMVGVTTALGVMGAAVGGYAIGNLLDSWIGKAFKLRGELLSTEAALKMGESDSFNNFVSTIGKTFGIQSIVDVAVGNKRRNAQEREAYSEGLAGAGQRYRKTTENLRNTTSMVPSVWGEGTTPELSTVPLFSQGQQTPVQVGGTIEIAVSDDRVRVKKMSKSRNGPDFATGQNSQTP